MKKCPKCGTILDDSKKTCYMCGTSLNQANFSRFGDMFDSQIGATISETQDNVFSEQEDLNPFKEDLKKKKENSSFISNDKVTSHYFNENLNNLNEFERDERSNLKKEWDNIFNKEEFKSKNDAIREKKEKEEALKQLEIEKERKRIEKEAALEKKREEKEKRREEQKELKLKQEERKRQIEERKERIEQEKEEQKKKTQVKKDAVTEDKKEEAKVREKKETKKEINWGEYLPDKKEEQNRELSPKQKRTLIFNLVCILVFVALLAFVFLHFFHKNVTDTDSLGGLYYHVEKEFKLKSEDSGSRYYTYEEDCALRITYGPVTEGDTYIDNYLNGIKEQYENEKDMINQVEEIKVNDNVWRSLSILNIVEDSSTLEGYNTALRYKYVSIVHKGNFYHTVYVNPNNNKTCSTMYNDFISSLAFE